MDRFLRYFYLLQSKSSWICRIPRLPFSIPEVHGHERAHKYLLVSRFPISIWAEVTACKQWAGLGWYSAPAPDTPLCPRTCYTAAVFEGITPPGPAPSSRPLPAGPRARLGRLTSVVLSGGWRPVVDTLFTSVSPALVLYSGNGRITAAPVEYEAAEVDFKLYLSGVLNCAVMGCK